MMLAVTVFTFCCHGNKHTNKHKRGNTYLACHSLGNIVPRHSLARQNTGEATQYLGIARARENTGEATKYLATV